MNIRITYDVDNIHNKFNIDMFTLNKNPEKELLELILLNKNLNKNSLKHKIQVGNTRFYTYNNKIVNSFLNKMIE